MITTSAATTTRTRAGMPAWWLPVAWLLLVALHLWIAWGVTGPIVLQDESGYLGNARWLVGLSPVPEMGEAPVYAWGYSFVIAPLVALIGDPASLYRAVQVANALLMASLLPALWLVLRDVGRVRARPAALAALAGSVIPAALVNSSLAWSESLVPLLVTLVPLAVWWAVTDRPTWQRPLIAILAVALYASHPRFLPVLALVVIGLVVGAWKRVLPTGAAVAGVVIATAGWMVVRVVDAALLDARWPDRVDGNGDGVASDVLGRFADPTNLPEFVLGSIGQAWYLAAGSLGLAVAGVLAAAWWYRHRAATDQRVVIAATGLAIAALFVTSVISFVGTAERVDHVIYGRYNEAFLPLLVAAGAAGLLVARSVERSRLLVWTASTTALLGATLMVVRGPNAFLGEVVWNNILGIWLAAELGPQRWIVPGATLIALVALAAVWLLARHHRGVAVGSMVAALVVSSLVAVGPLADFATVRYEGWVFPEQLDRVVLAADTSTLALDPDESGLMAVHGYPFWSPELRFAFGDDGPDLIVAAVDSSATFADEARIVALDGRNDQAVWVRRGTSTFERLDDLGAVLPPGFPAELPRRAQVADITAVGDGSAVVELSSGESATVAVDIEHTGLGNAWPSDAEWPLPGVVRIGARWYDDAGALIRDDERTVLPAPMWPGDRVTSTVHLRATDGRGSPLAPGRYQVALSMVQEGFTWFDDEGAERFVLSVVVV